MSGCSLETDEAGSPVVDASSAGVVVVPGGECRGLLGVNAPEVSIGSSASVTEFSREESTELDDLVELADLCGGDEGVTVMVPVNGAERSDSGERVYVSA
jgi:hypothetical protein